MISSEFDDVSPEIKDVIHRALPRFLLWRDESKLSERKIQSISEEFGEFVKKTSNWSHGNVALELFALPRDIFEFDYNEENGHWYLKEFPRFFAKTKEILNIALCLTIYIVQKSIKLYTPAIRTKTPPNEPVKSEIYIKEYPEVFFIIKTRKYIAFATAKKNSCSLYSINYTWAFLFQKRILLHILILSIQISYFLQKLLFHCVHYI